MSPLTGETTTGSGDPTDASLHVPGHLVGLWATLNLALALVLLFYSRDPLPILLHVGGVALIATFGVAVAVSARRSGIGPSSVVAHRSLAAAAAGLVAVLAVWGVVYGWWFWILGITPALTLLSVLRAERLSRAAAAGSPGVERAVAVERPPSRAEVRRRGLEVAADRRRRRRGEAT